MERVMTMEEINRFAEDHGSDEGMMIFENPSYETAFVGIDTMSGRAIYDHDLMIEYLMENEDMDQEEATEFIDYNSSFSGEGYPIIMKKFDEGEYSI